MSRPDDRPRVLVADDNATNRRVAELQLARFGADVVVAEDGRAALGRLASAPFDLVLLDGMMPGLDGPATAREIRRREAAAGLERIPIVALTASSLPEDRRLMLDAGMDDLVAKPLRLAELGAVLERWLPSGRRDVVIAPGGPEIASARPPLAAHDVHAPEPVDAAAVRRLGELGDAAFVARLVDVLLADAAERVTQVDEALETDDGAALDDALVALDRIARTIGASAIRGRVRELREHAASGSLTGESGLGTLLAHTSERLCAHLADPPSP